MKIGESVSAGICRVGPEALWDEYARSMAATARHLTILPE